jgi:thiol-disulfide isomerase/thioredoxin
VFKKLLSYFILFYFCTSYSQESTPLFSQILKLNSAKYIEKSNEAFAKNDITEGKQLFDSLVSRKLIGTQFDNFTVKTFSSKKISLDKINKPLLIVTYASWCVINKGDIPALNQLARKHKDDLQIMIVFWGNKTDAKKTSKAFNKHIQVTYTGFEENENYEFVSLLKNTLGFPTSYFLDTDKKVVTICRVNNPYFLNTSHEKALSDSYEQFSNIINYNNTLAITSP